MKSNEIKLTDIVLASTLNLFVELKSVERSDDNKLTFVFQDTPQIRNLIDKTLKQQIVVEPLAFSNKLRNLKSLIHLGGTHVS
jgi:hypothetical protein